MKNKAISLSLVLIMTFSSLSAVVLPLDQSSSTSAASWKDPASGMTYNNFGSVSFKFKKTTTSFAPWMKARAPSISAGCGGISMDGGFASFLDLETIGKQLEQAVSSIGMGVIVVLMQTMPSIAKAFEDIQKLIRKLQSMLANACQSTVALLNSTPAIKESKDKARNWMSENSGASFVNKQMGGALKKVEEWEKMLDCGTGLECAVSNVKLLLGGANVKKEEGTETAKAKGVSSKTGNALASIFTVADTKTKVIWKDTIKKVYEERKFEGRVVSISAEYGVYEELKIALFGTLAVPYKDGVDIITGIKDGKLDSDPAAIKEMAKEIEDGKGLKPTYKLQYYPAVNNEDDISNFFTGEGLIGTATNVLSIPSDFNIVTIIVPEDTKPDAIGGSLLSFTYQEAGQNFSDSNTHPLEWAGIQTATYETILNALDSIKYPAPQTPIGVFMPKGDVYVSMIKEYAEAKDYPKYADLLAKINVKYAVQDLVRSARTEAVASLSADLSDDVAINAYLYTIESRSKAILKKIEDFSGDVAYLNDIDQVFMQLKKTAKEERMLRVRGE